MKSRTHTSTPDFYDQLAPLYHLIHQNWDASLVRQGEQLGGLIDANWPGSKRVLDVACGIGTQAIALALRGRSVQASDLSAASVSRATAEARARGLDTIFSVCDMRSAYKHHGGSFDVVICCDNSLPHLLDDDAILGALRQMHACLDPGGGCLLTVRDYAREERGRNLVKPFGVRVDGGKRYLLFQVWDFEGQHCDLAFFFVEEDLASHAVLTHVMRSRYYAIPTDRMCELMRAAGFSRVQRVDDAFYQPVLVGSKTA